MEWNVIPELIINKTCPFSHTTGGHTKPTAARYTQPVENYSY